MAFCPAAYEMFFCELRSFSMNLFSRFMTLFVCFGFLGLGGLRADTLGLVSVEELQAQIVAQMKSVDDLVAQKNTALAELVRRQKNNAPADQVNQVQFSIDALSKLLSAAQQKTNDLNNKMLVMQAQPKHG